MRQVNEAHRQIKENIAQFSDPQRLETFSAVRASIENESNSNRQAYKNLHDSMQSALGQVSLEKVALDNITSGQQMTSPTKYSSMYMLNQTSEIDSKRRSILEQDAQPAQSIRVKNSRSTVSDPRSFVFPSMPSSQIYGQLNATDKD